MAFGISKARFEDFVAACAKAAVAKVEETEELTRKLKGKFHSQVQRVGKVLLESLQVFGLNWKSSSCGWA
jgi:hypothetical protein